MKILILFTSLLLLCHCGEIPFTDEDTPTTKPEVTEETAEPDSLQPDHLQTETAPPLMESNPAIPLNTENKETETQATEELPPEEPPFTAEEITLISEDLELTEDTVIKNRKVVLDMVSVKTFEHDLFHHSRGVFIQSLCHS